MTRDPRYDILFEPVAIGPHVAKNRFFQVPHCNGGGYRDPSAAAQMRRVKAEGGWGVVFTEQCDVHHSGEITPFIELRLWDDADIPLVARMAERIHAHDALAGIELVYPSVNGPNFYTREVPMAPSAMPVRTFTNDPVSARAMTKKDVADVRRWHVNAARRARQAGFDLICLYGAHGFGIIQHFLSTATNRRSDEYGGSLENRARFLAELVADVKEAVGDACAVSVRLSLEEVTGALGFSNAEARDLVGLHGELPDLWDFAHGAWEDCSRPSRFGGEAGQQDLVAGMKALTTKPVVGVGWFTTPDVMVRQVKSGVLDLVGCARPSIADPFLPKKIEEGRNDEIRECIGCNICITGDMTMSPSRCTQNPTFMEEWRRGWHPERVNPKGAADSVLVVGAGPAGLEAARVLGLRGYRVALAEASTSLGGRVAREARLPGLAAWGRVKDYREYQLSQMANVDVYYDSFLGANDILDFGFEHVAIATGSTWRQDGVARHHVVPMPIDPSMLVLTPDDLMVGDVPDGRVVVYDDDHYYMGGVLADLLVQQGARVTLVTPSAFVSEWTNNTLEQRAIHAHLARLDVDIVLNRAVTSVEAGGVRTGCVFSGANADIAADAVVLVTSRVPIDRVWRDLAAREAEWEKAGIRSARVIGDAESPGPIAWATFAGHRFAREVDEPDRGDALPFRREVTGLAPDP